MHGFLRVVEVHQFSNLIRHYRDEAEKTRQELLEKALHQIQQGENAEKILQELSYKLMNKLIHAPTQTMQAMMKSGNAEACTPFQMLCI